MLFSVWYFGVYFVSIYILLFVFYCCWFHTFCFIAVHIISDSDSV